jgi:hypothetical protein
MGPVPANKNPASGGGESVHLFDEIRTFFERN